MMNEYTTQLPDNDPDESAEWLESIASVVDLDGAARAAYLLRAVVAKARQMNVGVGHFVETDYINTIPPESEPQFPGDEGLEKRIRRIVRWNAMAMVHRANKRFEGLGGHLSTYASAATLYEVGFNHFFRGRDATGGGDQVFIQGHAAPGVYARAFLEGRLSEAQLDSFRRETGGQGLSSYPHPWLMPEFWQFPTVSMGLGPITAIYQARFNRYLHNRGMKDTSEQRVWCFVGDGETDEPESLGAISLAGRERLDNLVFVVNCNLQRLDGPVRGNGKIIQELETMFRGAGWHVIKVIWGPEWNELLTNDVDGLLVQRMNEVPDGQFQKYSAETGEYIRRDFFGKNPRLLKLVENKTDDDLKKLRRGGHSLTKVYAAYKAATEHEGKPVVLLCKTVKGWTLGDSFMGTNPTHQMKKLDEEQLRKFRDTLHLDIPDSRLAEAPYFHPGEKSPEIEYLLERRRALGGPLPLRRNKKPPFKAPALEAFKEVTEGTKPGMVVSTTMAFVRLLRTLLRDKELGKNVVPIIPDEGRTFGMEALFREVGIYAPFGQKYEPVDSKLFLNYHEAKDGQILEEGITEAGSMASFTAAGTSYATHGVTMVPFYTFYSMFGLQRTMDQIWAVGDARGRGFLMGATAGRTTLNGEGLQHEDGQSHLYALAVPNLIAYDPAYGYELALIIRDGLRRMLDNNEDVFYYVTIYNENMEMPALPSGELRDTVSHGVIKGMYGLPGASGAKKAKAQLLGSGPMLRAALEAQKLLRQKWDIDTNVYSVTSYQQLYREARALERNARQHPGDKTTTSHFARTLSGMKGPVVCTSDWVSELPSLLSRFIPNRLVPLGTNGYGRSDTREALRNHFEIDGRWTAYATLHALMLDGEIEADVVREAQRALEIDPDKVDPATA